MAYIPPSAVQAQAMAELMDVGVPAVDAVRVVAPELAIEVVPEVARRWEKDPAVRMAQVQLMGADWRKLSDKQRMETALRRHYNQMAYYLASTDYNVMDPAKQAKADKCRDALEKKVAGTAGQSDPLAMFYETFQRRVLAGEVKFPERIQ